jgi:integrase
LEAYKRHLRSKGYSTVVASKIAEPQAASTSKVYNSKWQHWLNWCTSRKVKPTSPTMPQVGQFLHYLFTNCKLECSTIEGYRASLASAFKHKSKLQVSTDPELAALLQRFRRDRPPLSHVLPGWDVSLVCWRLTEAPFEPLHKANLVFLTWKLAFLLLLASGCRRGEIHAIKRAGVYMASTGQYVTLSPSPMFVSKTRLRNRESVKPIRIPSLKQVAGSDLPRERSLCPVRCLKHYLKRTKGLAGKRKLLFLGTQANRKTDIGKSTLSSWVKNLIKYCYNNPTDRVAELTGFRTHDIRGIGTTLVYKGTPNMEDLLTAGTWKSDNTFLSHYLKDLSEVSAANLIRIGPIVAARKVVVHSTVE